MRYFEHSEELARREAAQQRALALLRESLSPHQRAQFNAHRAFTCVGNVTGKTYWIHWGWTMNITGPDGHRMCAVPSALIPVADQMLAQKLMIECEEDYFLTIAKRRRILTPDYRSE